MGCRVSGNRDGYIGSIDTAVGYRYRDAVFSVVLHSFSTIISGAVYMKPFKNVQVGATIDLPLEKEKPEIYSAAGVRYSGNGPHSGTADGSAGRGIFHSGYNQRQNF